MHKYLETDAAFLAALAQHFTAQPPQPDPADTVELEREISLYK